MSDLSRLLDDLYALPSTDAESSTDAPPAQTRAPEWSSEQALDDVFATWVPGPSDDASSTQRSMVASMSDEPVHAAPEDGWLRETEPAAEEPAVPARPRWSPSDDDILPTKRGRRR